MARRGDVQAWNPQKRDLQALRQRARHGKADPHAGKTPRADVDRDRGQILGFPADPLEQRINLRDDPVGMLLKRFPIKPGPDANFSGRGRLPKTKPQPFP